MTLGTDRGDGGDTMTRKTIITAAVWTAVLLACATAAAQKGREDRRVYCWEESGRKVCGDALPASAVDAPRTEFSARNALSRQQVGRALSSEERAAAAQAAREAAPAAASEAARQRRDRAKVESNATEADPPRAYGERITLVDEVGRESRRGRV